MNNGLGYKLANVPTITGLSTVSADSVISDSITVDTIILNGNDISVSLNQIPINTDNIATLQQQTTGISYSDVAGIDLTTIDNNVTITSSKKLKCSTVPTANDDVANKLYIDTSIANLIDSSPATLDTLNELAAALGDDPNFATTVTNSIATKASLTANQTISGINNLSNPLNVFYGSGTNLTGISASLLTTTSMPSTGTFYSTWLTSATGASGLTAYSDGNISYDRGSNRLIVPNLRSFGQIEIDNTTPIITTRTTASDLILRTVNASTGSLRLQTGATDRFTINSSGVATFTNVPLCSVIPSSADMLCNKTYVDSTIALISTTTIPATGTYFTTFTNSATGASNLIPYTDSNISYDRTNNNITINATNNLYFNTAGINRIWIAPGGAIRCSNFISFNSTSQIARQILNTYYNFHDNDATAGGTFRARMYSTPSNLLLEINAGLSYIISINAVNLFTISSTDITSTIPINAPAPTLGTHLCNKTYVDSASSFLTTTTMPGSGTFYATWTNSSTGASGLTAYTDINISYNKTIDEVQVPNFRVQGDMTIGTATPTISTLNVAADLTIFTLAGSTGSLRLQTAATDRLTISSAGLSTFTGTVNVISTVSGGTPSFFVRDTVSSNQLNVIVNATAGSFNPLVQAADQVIYSSGTINTEVLSLTTHSSTTTGVRISPNALVIGSGGASLSGNPNARINFDGSAGTITSTAPADITLNSATNLLFQTAGVTKLTLSGTQVVSTVPLIIPSCGSSTNFISFGASLFDVTSNVNPRFNSQNIILNSLGVATTFGCGSSTVSNHILITNDSLVTTRNFVSGGNIVIGSVAANSMTNAAYQNIVIGLGAALNMTSGNGNIVIGNNNDPPTASGNNQIVLGRTEQTMFIQGGLSYRVGTIVSTITLSGTMAQLYTVVMNGAARIINIPNPTDANMIGVRVIFKRKGNTIAYSIACAGAVPFILINSITPLAGALPIGTTLFQIELMSDGVNWMSINQT